MICSTITILKFKTRRTEYSIIICQRIDFFFAEHAQWRIILCIKRVPKVTSCIRLPALWEIPDKKVHTRIKLEWV